jgi:hypothetical protein
VGKWAISNNNNNNNNNKLCETTVFLGLEKVLLSMASFAV